MPDHISELLSRLPAVSLSELDDRAALLRRVDNKYAVEHDLFVELLDQLREDHEVLEIGERREFAYRTTYFETPDLRCFTDHVEGRVPRFKARTRLYEDSNDCVFEVKFKRADDQTDKRQIDYPAADHERLTQSARRCLESALRDAGLELPKELAPSLHTSFERITLAAPGQGERLTCDRGVRLSSPNGTAAVMRADRILLETKTERGDSPADRALRRLGREPISLSKYRVGMSLVGNVPIRTAQPGSELFVDSETGPVA